MTMETSFCEIVAQFLIKASMNKNGNVITRVTKSKFGPFLNKKKN